MSVKPWPATFRIPLLKDYHSHPLFYAACMDGLDLRKVHSKSDALQQIASKSSDNELLVVLGWVDSQFDLAPSELDAFGQVAVFNLSLHGLVLSPQAKTRLAKIAGVEIENWSDQEWHDRNFNRILNCFAQLNGSAERLSRFYRWLESEHGVGYAEELLLVDEREIEIYEEAGLRHKTRFWSSPETFATLSEQAQRKVHGLKLFTDGAIGVRTAALHHEYLTGGTGLLIYSESQLTATLQHCLSIDKPIAIHAIGDRAIDQTVKILETLHSAAPFENAIRIEHAQLISQATAVRAKTLGITLCMQPNFSMDSADYRDRLPEAYLTMNNPFRMLIDDVGFVPGEDLIFGSDGMPHGVVEAIKASANPPFPESQQLTLGEFVAGYCDGDRANGGKNGGDTNETTEQLEISIAGDVVSFRRLG